MVFNGTLPKLCRLFFNYIKLLNVELLFPCNNEYLEGFATKKKLFWKKFSFFKSIFQWEIIRLQGIKLFKEDKIYSIIKNFYYDIALDVIIIFKKSFLRPYRKENIL